VDPLTQTALGALVAQACARRDRQGRAALAGGLGGMLPDADVLIRSASDPLLFLEYHRHFTHALAFVPVGALVAGTLAWLLGRGRWAWRELWLYAALGWLTHGPLDACTSYGTHLAWPFDEGRVAWGLIAIIDPLFTVPLLVGVGLGLSGRRLRRAWLVVALAYLALCGLQHQRAAAAQATLCDARGLAVTRRTVKPSIGTNLLFRSIVEAEGAYHVDAIRVPWVGTPRVVEGTRAAPLDLEAFEVRYPLDALQREDVERFRFFSDDYLIEHPVHPGVIGDLRYAALPDSLDPLWGIDARGAVPGEHLAYRTFRELDAAARRRYLDLVLGR